MTPKEQEYFEKLISQQFKELHEDISTIKETNEDILIQTTKTNGRVTDLEKWRNHTEGFNYGLKRSTGIMLIVLGILVGAAATWLWH